MSQRQRNQEQQQKKMERKQQQEYEEQMRIAQNKAVKDQLKQNIEQTKKGYEEKIKKEVDYVKMEKKGSLIYLSYFYRIKGPLAYAKATRIFEGEFHEANDKEPAEGGLREEASRFR